MAKTKMQQARVLGGFALDGVDYNPNDVIEASPDMIKSLGSSVDSDPDAVKFCLTLDKPIVKKHQSSTSPAEQQAEEQAEVTGTAETQEQNN